MSSSMKCLVLFYFVLSAAALATPHINRNMFNHHRAVAAHVQSPAPVVDRVVPVVNDSTPSLRRKRSLNKRCKQRSSTSSSATPTATPAPVNVAPTPTTASPATTTTPPVNVAPAPATTSSSTTPTTTATPPAQTTSNNNGNGNLPQYLVGTQSGDGTFYGTGLGSCGITNTDTDYIAAVSHLLYDKFPGYSGGNPNNNPICGKKVTATYLGKSVSVTITDRCTGCDITDLDFSPTAFLQLAPKSVGRIHGMTWVWDDLNLSSL